MISTIIISGQPVSARDLRVTRFRAFYTPRYNAWKKRAAEEVALAWGLNPRRPPLTCPVIIDVVAYFEIPKSWSKVKKAAALSGELKHITKPDGDNVLKAAKDALTFGGAIKDDRLAWRSTITKLYGPHPYLSISIGWNP